jgi:DNA-binding NarL/FixJ family response regulator
MKSNNVKEDTHLAQTGTETETVITTNCSICRGKRSDRREAINRALGRGMSYRDIEVMTGVAYRTIGNHAQHLPANLQRS